MVKKYLFSIIKSKFVRVNSAKATGGWLLRRCGSCDIYDEDFEV